MYYDHICKIKERPVPDSEFERFVYFPVMFTIYGGVMLHILVFYDGFILFFFFLLQPKLCIDEWMD